MIATDPEDDRARRFEAFYRFHRQSIADYVQRRVIVLDAEDVVAQVFLVAWRRFEVIPPPPEDRLWLFGVARRMVADHRRSTMRRLRLTDRLVGEARGPDSSTESFGLLHARVDAALEILRPAEREVLRLVLWEGLSHNDASTVLGCTANAVELRYRRARIRFREAFLAPEQAHRSPDQFPTAPTVLGSPRGGRSQGGSMPRALITGITGQDGRYLAELLIGKGYQVHGMIRGQNNPKARIVQDEIPEIELIDGDLTDLSSLIAAVEQVQPDEVYNLGAISFVKLSFSQPELTADVTGAGVLRMLEAIRIVGGAEQPDPLLPGGDIGDVRQGARVAAAGDDSVPSPLALRDGQGVRLLHDPELPRVLRHPRLQRHPLQSHQSRVAGSSSSSARSPTPSPGSRSACKRPSRSATSTRRGTSAIAGDYVEAMWRMLQQEDPRRLRGGDRQNVVNPTESSTWPSSTIGIEDWSPYVTTDDRFLRPAEVDQLVGDASRARDLLGWEPKVDFPQVLEEMVRHDIEMERAKAGLKE